jgi:hypothetical protein
MEWWTAANAAEWEEARLDCTWTDFRAKDDGIRLTLRCPRGIADASVLWLDPNGSIERWGFRFASEPVTAAAEGAVRLGVRDQG